MDILKAVMLMAEGQYITHPKFKNNGFVDYYLEYYNDEIYIMSNWEENKEICLYNFDMADILSEKWEIFNYS